MTLLSPNQITRLHACDTPLDSWPLRAVAPPRERILHVHLDTNDDPQWGMQHALNLWGGDVARINWTRVSNPAARRQIVETCRLQQPTLVFMQLQTPGVLNVETLRATRKVAPDALLVTWCGDVGGNNGPHEPPAGWAWLDEFADNVHLCLFTSTTQAEVLRDRGYPNASYLQIGYDQQWFNVAHRNALPKYRAAFLGQNYGINFDTTMPNNDAPLRAQLVKALKNALGAGFFLGGGGWGGLEDAFVPSKDSAGIYDQSALAVSLSLAHNLGRYSSDRLLRCLACGVPTFVREFKGMSSWGLRHLDNCIVWPREMSAEQAAEWIAHFRPADTIGQNGALLAQQHHTWEVRMRELAVYLAALRGVGITTETL